MLGATISAFRARDQTTSGGMLKPPVNKNRRPDGMACPAVA